MAGKAPRRILAISGSLRAGSSNTAALQALQRLAPPTMVVTLFDGLRAIPPFDPDEDGPALPAPVAAIRAAVGAADAVVIASPEYARGVAGTLKNALDWLVGGPEMVGKGVALLNTAPRAVHAQAALRLTLETMSARIVEEACVTLPLRGGPFGARDIVDDAAMAATLRGALAALHAIQ